MSKVKIGKRNEFVMWALLLQNGIDVYPSLVDDKGIDGIVGYNGKLFEVQIKSAENWYNHRGIAYETCKQNPDRIFIIYNYSKKELRFVTGKQIIKEPEWQKTIRYQISQLKWNKKMLDKYKDQDLKGLISYIKDPKSPIFCSR
ncbi:hypothetical protein JXB41_04050 [Candidatus Woesearchaeota archaeon]|nr:hypothetical protein [Candidatus Woesearchaeota archaeon]